MDTVSVRESAPHTPASNNRIAADVEVAVPVGESQEPEGDINEDENSPRSALVKLYGILSGFFLVCIELRRSTSMVFRFWVLYRNNRCYTEGLTLASVSRRFVLRPLSFLSLLSHLLFPFLHVTIGIMKSGRIWIVFHVLQLLLCLGSENAGDKKTSSFIHVELGYWILCTGAAQRFTVPFYSWFWHNMDIRNHLQN